MVLDYVVALAETPILVSPQVHRVAVANRPDHNAEDVRTLAVVRSAGQLVLGYLAVLPMLLRRTLGDNPAVDWCSVAVAVGNRLARIHLLANDSGLAALPEPAADGSDPTNPLRTLGRAHYLGEPLHNFAAAGAPYRARANPCPC